MRGAHRHNVPRVAGKPPFVKASRQRGGGGGGGQGDGVRVVLSVVCLTHDTLDTRRVTPIRVKRHRANSLAVSLHQQQVVHQQKILAKYE